MYGPVTYFYHIVLSSERTTACHSHTTFSKMNLSNRSDHSDFFQDRELIEAVLQRADENKLNVSDGSRLSSLMLTQPSMRSAGTLSRPPSIVSKHSVTLSKCQERLSEVGHDFLPVKEDHTLLYEHLKVNVLVLSLLCLCSLMLGYMAIQLIIALATQQTSDYNSVLSGNRTRMTVQEVATALSTFVLALNVTCLLVCSLQSLIIVKLLRVHLGDERSVFFYVFCL